MLSVSCSFHGQFPNGIIILYLILPGNAIEMRLFYITYFGLIVSELTLLIQGAITLPYREYNKGKNILALHRYNL